MRHWRLWNVALQAGGCLPPITFVVASGSAHTRAWRIPAERFFQEYDKNSEDCYIIMSKHQVGGGTQLCWDTTCPIHQYGQYINHALQPNAILTSLFFFVQGKYIEGRILSR